MIYKNNHKGAIPIMDPDTINQRFDLLTLAQGETALKKTGLYHVGPCPFCGGRDRFTLKATAKGDRWHCRKCGDGRYHSAIDYLMRRDDLSFKDALRMLETQGTLAPAGIRPREPDHHPAVDLPSLEWQREALVFVDAAQEALLVAPEAEPVRRYLEAREISLPMWYQHLLGFTSAYDPACQQVRLALVLPHFDNDFVITAIKMRFTDPVPGGLRYISRKGSKPVFFGLHTTFDHHDGLILVEGEINAISILMCGFPGFSVVSFGSEDLNQAQKGLLPELARRYRRVVIWTDKGRKASAVEDLIGRPCIKLRSPFGRDANDLLMAGFLREFLSRLIPG
jgi:DNA primase